MRRRLPYSHEQAAGFLAICVIFGAMGGALWAASKGALR